MLPVMWGMRLRKADMCPALFSVFIFSIKVSLGHVLNVSLPVSRAVRIRVSFMGCLLY